MRSDLRGRPPGLSSILPNLLVGEYPRVTDVAWLRDTHAITAVVCLQDESDLWDKGIDAEHLEAAYRRATIVFRRIPVEDYSERDLEAALARGVGVLDELLEAGHTVLLHCNAGYNRAPTLAIAYLCARRGMALDEAVEHVKSRRSCLPYVSVLRRRFA